VHVVRARALVNAAGPWVEDRPATRNRLELLPRRAPRQGSHVVVPNSGAAPMPICSRTMTAALSS